ncbi:HIT family protein [Deinococcus cavernae]|uniref:HIT family protein n=1 Tax=Deinococcus cavernae TaxID=2320857 RepID=A0A418V8S7_9DEIO|nr:HIT family protein [Deinococcus cavernae]RJF72477.1 HIT family protein [Deinococcus cavernae]
MSGDSCIFCQIVAGEAEASLVAENDLCLAFLTIGPFNTGHTLVVPRRHAATFTDLTPEEASALIQLSQRVAQALQQSELPCEGLNLWMANGKAAFQDVFHAHMHVFPRLKDDGFKVEVSWPQPSRAELNGVAAQLRAALEQSA